MDEEYEYPAVNVSGGLGNGMFMWGLKNQNIIYVTSMGMDRITALNDNLYEDCELGDIEDSIVFFDEVMTEEEYKDYQKLIHEIDSQDNE